MLQCPAEGVWKGYVGYRVAITLYCIKQEHANKFSGFQVGERGEKMSRCSLEAFRTVTMFCPVLWRRSMTLGSAKLHRPAQQSKPRHVLWVSADTQCQYWFMDFNKQVILTHNVNARGVWGRAGCMWKSAFSAQFFSNPETVLKRKLC